MAKAPIFLFFFFFIFLLLLSPIHSSTATTPSQQPLKLHHHAHPHCAPPSSALSASDKFKGSSNLIHLRYHMGPVLSSPINIYLIWYGRWAPHQQLLLKDFLLSISSTSAPSPSVSDWWCTVSLYTDQTGANVSRSLLIACEFSDAAYSHSRSLTRLSIQQVIHNAVSASCLAVDPRNGIYLVLTSPMLSSRTFAAPSAVSTTSPSPSPPSSATLFPKLGSTTLTSSAPMYAPTPSPSPATCPPPAPSPSPHPTVTSRSTE